MNDSKRDKIVDLITKMSALKEEGSGAFQGEISAASAKIQELMDKYSISWGEVHAKQAEEQEKEFSEEFTFRESTYTHKGLKKWHWQLGKLIARVTHTKYYSTIGYHSKRMSFFGTKENVEIASQLYTLWVVNIQDMSKKATEENYKMLLEKYKSIRYEPRFRENVARMNPDDDPRYFGSSWISGCISAMSDNVFKQEASRTQEVSKAIVVYEDAVRKQFKKFSEGFTTTKSSSNSRGFSSSGFESGKKVGSSISIGSKFIGSGRKALEG